MPQAAGAVRDFYADQAKNLEPLNKARVEVKANLAAYDFLAGAWPGFAAGRKLAPDAPASASFAHLAKSSEALRKVRNDIVDANAGNVNLFVSDQISLYYFTDVNRLMKALNPAVHTVESPTNASGEEDRIRKELRQREIEMRDAYDSLAGLTTRLINLTVDLETAKSSLKQAQDKRDLYARNLDLRKAEKDKADKEVARLKALVPPLADDDPKLVAAQANAKKADDAQTQALADDTQSQTDLSQAQTLVSSDLNEKNGLPSQIQQAEVAATTASTLLKQKRNQLSGLAVDENAAFALARDNAPYLLAEPDALSSDPAKRVYLYAYNDSKTIFVRGLPDDVAAVKDMVAEFDRPAPQARITLWTLQMNVQASRNGRQKLGNAMEKVERHLSEIRSLTAMATSVLRDEVNQEVQQVERDNLSRFKIRLTRSTTSFMLDSVSTILRLLNNSASMRRTRHATRKTTTSRAGPCPIPQEQPRWARR